MPVDHAVVHDLNSLCTVSKTVYMHCAVDTVVRTVDVEGSLVEDADSVRSRGSAYDAGCPE